MLNEHAGRYEHLAMAAIVVGVIGAGALRAAAQHRTGVGPLTITLVLVGLGVASLLPYFLRAIGHPHSELTMVCAGLAFGWSGVATKLAADDLGRQPSASPRSPGASRPRRPRASGRSAR